jgi:hypothetical protein
MVVTACCYDADRLKARIDLSPVSACRLSMLRSTAIPAGTRSSALPPVSAFRSRLPHGEALVEATS